MDKWLGCLGPKTTFIAANKASTVFALNKGCGILSHPNKPAAGRSASPAKALLLGSYDFAKEAYATPSNEPGAGPIRSYLVHRLDQDTSGVMLVTNDRSTADQIKRLFKQRLLQKDYYAMVFGIMPKQGKAQLWEDDYEKRSQVNGSSVRAATPSGRTLHDIARTEVAVLQQLPALGMTLVQLSPITGFAHQLRFQCSQRGYPIVGDDVYGNFVANKSFFPTLKSTLQASPQHSSMSWTDCKRLYLHAHRISCKDPARLALLPEDCCAPIPPAYQFVQQMR